MMTPAEFRCTREHLGLTTKWLARRWSVSEYSVQRWERDRTLPPDLEADLVSIKRYADERIDLAVRMHADGFETADDPIDVPRMEDNDMPPAFWRSVAWEAADRTGCRITYAGRGGEVEPGSANTFARTERHPPSS